MKIEINTQKLNQALKATERVVGKNVSLPILSTVLMETQKGYLVLSTTNLEMGMRYKIGVKTEEEGRVAVPVKILSDFISNVNDEKISLSCSKDVLKITSHNYKTSILGIKSDEFPIIPQVKKDQTFTINGNKLRYAISSVLDSVSNSETRPELTGVFIRLGVNEGEFVATDSYRLSEVVIEKKGEDKFECIVPYQTTLEMSRLAEDEDLEIGVSGNQLYFKGGNYELVSRLIDGHYPDYKKVIPTTYESRVFVNKSELEKGIRVAGVFSSSIADLRLDVEKDKTRIISQNSEKGDVTATIKSELDKSPFSVSVNYQYALDGLKNITTEVVSLKYTGEGGPLIIENKGVGGYTYAIMPLRT